MRIISGKYRRRQLISPPDAVTTRPIPDRVKESLFSLLRGHFEGATVLDAFAGTGAIGLEALSRGATQVVFVERDRRAADVLQRNIESLGCGEECQLVRGDALGPALLARCPTPLSLAFFDPPYPLVMDPGEAGWGRVRRQFSRVIDLMTYEGFAVLRTPWPFRHPAAAIAAPDIPIATPLPSRKPWRKGDRGKRHERRSEEREWIGDGVDLRAIQAETEREARQIDEGEGDELAATEPDTVERFDVDLTLPNAIGPETHVYASMGVHLYMRKRTREPALEPHPAPTDRGAA